MQTTARFKLDDRIVAMRVITVEEMEAVAAGYSTEALNAGRGNQFGRDLIAASISHINDIPVDVERFDARREFPLSRDWNRLEKVYTKLNGLDRLPAVSPETSDREFVIILPSGKVIKLRSLTVDEDEKLEVDNRYGPADWLRRKHDRIALAITSIDGQTVDHAVCNLRVEVPLANDWVVLRTAQDKVESAAEDIPDFLPDTPA